MCVSGCLDSVARNLGRRDVLRSGLVFAAAAGGCAIGEDSVSRGTGGSPVFDRTRDLRWSRVVDLTHSYDAEFPHFDGGKSRVDLEVIASTENGDGWNVTRWTLDEHAGTHVDAPFHRNGRGVTVDRIPVENLVLPLAVVDICSRARSDSDAELRLEDLEAWEGRHGRIPDGACVALASGWDAKVKDMSFIGLDPGGVRHFPGFHVDAVRFLLAERRVTALGTDTASFDHGPTTDFPVHTLWLGADRWGIENLARLGELPPVGSTLICGAPKITGATGGPSRVLALV
jgi:kynurenine formamidase